MTKLGFGLMRLPIKEDDVSQIDMDLFIRMVDYYLNHGGKHFDTGYVYHNGYSETAFRDAVVKRYPRDLFTITDKAPIFMIKTKNQLEDIFEDQLQKCGVDYFDYYWIHHLSGRRYQQVKDLEVFEFLKRKKEEGKAKYIGFSFHDTANVLEQYLIEYPYIDYVQLQINYLDWLDPLVQSKKCYEVCLKHRKPVMVMEPIKGGSLINVPKEVEELFKSKSQKMSVASWAIRFVASLDNVKMVLSGMNSLEQLEDNMSYMTDFNPLDDDELSTIEQARELIRKSIAVPCTGCRYCVSENICPMNIAIPEYFRALNAKLGRYDVNGSKPKEYYQRTSAVHGLAGDCIECGGCEEKCPQHIKIRDYLKEVQKEFERLGE